MKELQVAINKLIQAFKGSSFNGAYPFDNLKINDNETITK
jgi:hypothetical protein